MPRHIICRTILHDNVCGSSPSFPDSSSISSIKNRTKKSIPTWVCLWCFQRYHGAPNQRLPFQPSQLFRTSTTNNFPTRRRSATGVAPSFQASKIGLRKVFLHEFVYDASKDIMAHVNSGDLSSHHNFFELLPPTTFQPDVVAPRGLHHRFKHRK